MSPLCDCCSEHMNKLNQHVSVMRKEIKNLRQTLDSAIRAHRKQLLAVQAAVSKIGLSKEDDKTPAPPSPSPAALEQGNIQTVPIGYISSCFSVKNGTPRQPTICGPSRAELRIQQSVFNNPEHALVGLEQYSHVWIIFLFHKNGHLGYKAKVRPPRLNGQRVGVYSTRSPHRPNALGLTLAKLDKIQGDTLHLSDIDMIAGTPVLDIKPYIPEYDSPDTRRSYEEDSEPCNSNTDQINEDKRNLTNLPEGSDIDVQLNTEDRGAANDYVGNLLPEEKTNTNATSSSHISAQLSLSKDLSNVLEEVKAFVNQDVFLSSESKNRGSGSPKTKPPLLEVDRPCYGEEAYTTIAGWIREPPVASLDVRFSLHAERELAEFIPAHLSGLSESHRPRFKFLRSTEEAVAAIRGVLSADPRSVYRRTRCKDRLFFFTLDTADITCWFGHGFAEVLQPFEHWSGLAVPLAFSKDSPLIYVLLGYISGREDVLFYNCLWALKRTTEPHKIHERSEEGRRGTRRVDKQFKRKIHDLISGLRKDSRSTCRKEGPLAPLDDVEGPHFSLTTDIL